MTGPVWGCCISPGLMSRIELELGETRIHTSVVSIQTVGSDSRLIHQQWCQEPMSFFHGCIRRLSLGLCLEV